ncbi:MAG: hypothetical protein KC877_01790 [Candidatus Kaiserbacteria bacterium]|nr:hypothetical protein [Candidatus Kaiserbacteria bacterium]MCB9815918.1 hypothetical protein [Candidatus Nomurabacteria bacterium]
MASVCAVGETDQEGDAAHLNAVGGEILHVMNTSQGPALVGNHNCHHGNPVMFPDGVSVVISELPWEVMESHGVPRQVLAVCCVHRFEKGDEPQPAFQVKIKGAVVATFSLAELCGAEEHWRTALRVGKLVEAQ